MDGTDDLAARLATDERVVAAATAHPELPAPDAAFVAFAAAHLAASWPDPADALAEAAFDDLLVAFHAGRGQPAAIDTVARLTGDLAGALRRTGAGATLISDLIEELPAELMAPRAGAAPRIHGYAGRGPLRAWLRVIAVRLLVERRHRAAPDAPLPDLAAAEDDPELQLMRRQYATEFAEALTWAVASLSSEDRALLRQRHVDGLDLDRLAELHRIHRATAARRVAAARELVFTRTRRRLLAVLRVSPATLDSIVRLVRSEVDVALDHYL